MRYKNQIEIKSLISILLVDSSYITECISPDYEWFILWAYGPDDGTCYEECEEDDPDSVEEDDNMVLVRQDQIEGYHTRDAFNWLNQRHYLTKKEPRNSDGNTFTDYYVNDKGKEVLQFILDHVTSQEWGNIVYWSNLGIDNAYAGTINNEYRLIVPDRSSDTYVVNPIAKQ